LLLLVILLLLLSLFDEYRGWRILLLTLVGAWLFSYRWALSLAENLRLRREIRFGWAQVGDQLEERFTLTNRGILPGLWVELVDHSNMPDYQTGLVTGIDSRANSQWRTHGLCTRRGLYTLGPTTLRSSDPLGLFTVEVLDPSSKTLMVTPPVVPLPAIEVAPGGRSGEGSPRPNAPERTVSAASVREFVSGDSLRWVHWPTTARRDDYYVRTFESTPSGDWWIILDVDKSIQVGKGAKSTDEHGVVLAASLADRGLRMGRSVGLVAHGEPLVWLPPKEGDGQLWQILRSLALLQPVNSPLGILLDGIRPTLGRYTSLVIITPNVSGDWLENLFPLLWQGCVPTIIILDPQAFGAGSSPVGIVDQLALWGMQRHLVGPELLDRPEAAPGQKGGWDWRVSPSGRAILVNPHRDISWKSLS